VSASSARLSQAMALAVEYRHHNRDGGDIVLAAATRRTIEDCVGRFEAGRLVLPAIVAAAMGRPELGGGP
jgi:hypothetical protein